MITQWRAVIPLFLWVLFIIPSTRTLSEGTADLPGFPLHWSPVEAQNLLNYLSVNATLFGPEQLYCTPSPLDNTGYKQNTVYIGLLGCNDPFVISLSTVHQDALVALCNSTCVSCVPGYIPPVSGEHMCVMCSRVHPASVRWAHVCHVFPGTSRQCQVSTCMSCVPGYIPPVSGEHMCVMCSRVHPASVRWAHVCHSCVPGYIPPVSGEHMYVIHVFPGTSRQCQVSTCVSCVPGYIPPVSGEYMYVMCSRVHPASVRWAHDMLHGIATSWLHGFTSFEVLVKEELCSCFNTRLLNFVSIIALSLIYSYHFV